MEVEIYNDVALGLRAATCLDARNEAAVASAGGADVGGADANLATGMAQRDAKVWQTSCAAVIGTGAGDGNRSSGVSWRLRRCAYRGNCSHSADAPCNGSGPRARGVTSSAETR